VRRGVQGLGLAALLLPGGATAAPPAPGYPQFPGDPEPQLDELPAAPVEPTVGEPGPSPPTEAIPRDTPAPDVPVAELPTPPDEAYALSVQLIGPAAARASLLEQFAPAVVEPALIDDPAVPGASVGVVLDRAAAMRWLTALMFGAPVGFGRELREVPAPPPGGDTYTRHDVVLASAWISAIDGEGEKRREPWPSDRNAVVPEGSAWRPASLVSSHAPLFSAPSPELPAALEAHDHVHRAGDLFVLGELDRCRDDGVRRCLRWFQIVAREGDRFFAGYLPAFMVSTDEAWVRAPQGLPRAQLQPSAISGARATYVLIARGLDGRLRRRSITAPTTDRGYGAFSVRIDGPQAVVDVEGVPTLHLSVDADLDDLDAPVEELLTEAASEP